MSLLAAPLLLVRVQDELHGARLANDGLRLPFDRKDSERNTVHFSVNSIVSDHAYGKFNENEDGSLRGKIVILADAADLPQAAGFGQVDTWFRLTSERDPKSGQVNRWLDVGGAVIVAPEGTEVPGGARAVYYQGGIEARDAAVQSVFDERGIKMEQAGFRNWLGHNWSSSERWALENAADLWGSEAKHTHLGGHDSSLDEALERSSVAGL